MCAHPGGGNKLKNEVKIQNFSLQNEYKTQNFAPAASNFIATLLLTIN